MTRSVDVRLIHLFWVDRDDAHLGFSQFHMLQASQAEDDVMPPPV